MPAIISAPVLPKLHGVGGAVLPLFLLNFGPKVSAQNSRIWMFFMAPLLITAAAGLEGESEVKWLLPVVVTAQALQTLALFYALDVWSL